MRSPFATFATAVTLMLAGCGGGRTQDEGEPSVEASIVGCDAIEYDGAHFDRIGCARGHGGFSVTVNEGDVFADLEVLCKDGCIAAVVVRRGSGDGETPDGGLAAAGEAAFGEPCTQDLDCVEGLFCDTEQQVSNPIRDLPGGVPDVLKLLFPGGSCTPIPIAPYGSGSCDPTQPQPLQGCGDGGACVFEPGFEEDFVACRARCEPSAEGSGCDRKFYTCDFSVRACVEGCQSDEECRAQVIDSDGDGNGDALVYDAGSEALCDDETRRCRHPGSGGHTGTACERMDDCEAEGLCLDTLQTFGGHVFPGGYCSKTGCEVEGRGCAGDDAICATVRSTSGGESALSACFTRCEVGADAAGDIVGADGHGAGCRPGYRCHYNGGAVDEGICVGGNYNDIDTPNVGAACEFADECHSPYGLGRCIYLAVGDVIAPTGVCTLNDCAAPGLPGDLCGAGNSCIVLSGDTTFCVPQCETADTCAEGFACVDEDGNPATPQICFPGCVDDGECRTGQRCVVPAGAGVGACET